MAAYKLRVQLRCSEPKCSRTVLVPTNFTFKELSLTINAMMGWSEFHLHLFEIPAYGIIISDDVDKEEEALPENTPLSDYEGLKMVYNYDFGDDWECNIVFLKGDESYDEPHPRVIKVVGPSPPEDCGGPWGFNEIYNILQDPDDPEYEEWVEWLGTDELVEPSLEELNAEMYVTHRENR